MKRKFTFLIAAAVMLLTMVATTGTMWGQTTESVTLSNGSFETDHITWTCAGGKITIQQIKGTSGTAVNSNYISAPRVYKGHVLSFVGTDNYMITSISITYNGNYYGNSMTAGTVMSGNTVTDNTTDVARTWSATPGGTHVVSSVSDDGLDAIYIQNVASGSNVQLRPTAISITYIIPSATEPSVSAENLEIAYNATSGEIEYTINNPTQDGELTASSTAEWISNIDVDETVTFTTTTNEGLYSRSATVTLTYTYNTDQTAMKNVTVTQTGNPNASGGVNNPYTVAQAIAAIDAGTGTTGVYAHGIISSVESFNSNYNSITYYISNDGTTTSDQLEAFSGKGLNNANFSSINDLQVGDIVTIYGNLTKYGETYEFSSGNYLVAYEHPVIPTITVAPATVNALAAGLDGTLNVTYESIETSAGVDIYWCESDGTTAATYDHEWVLAEPNSDLNVYYVIGANTGDDRTAYFKVLGLDAGSNEVYSNLVTINQAANVPTYTVTFNVDGGIFVPNADFATINENKTAGTYNLPSATKAGWDFAGWNDGTTTYEANDEYQVSAAVTFTAQWTQITTGTIIFGSATGSTAITVASLEGQTATDNMGNTWTITTVFGSAGSSFTQNSAYTQVGASSKPATSITFTTTLAQSTTFTAFSAKFGGFNGTAGTVTLKVGETTVGSGSLNGGSDVIIENTSSATGTVLTVTVTGISKGVKCYYISYTISTGSDPMIIAQNSIDLSSTDTYGEFDYSIVNPGTGQLTASSTDGWISNINVTAEKVTFVTTPNTSTTDNREGTITLSYPNAANKNVTVTQSKVDYATMPFVFDGGKNELPTGLTGTLGNDYGSSPKLGFRNTGDNLILKLNEAPVSIIYDIKGNSFSGGTFKVQVSADGTTYNDLKEYTTLGDTQADTIINNTNTVRYIKWIYTNKSNGNVALGNIQVYDVEFTIIKNNAIINDLTIADGTAYVVENGVVLTLTGTVTNTNPANLIIEDGGQLIHNGNVNATLKKNVAASPTWGSRGVSGWYTIASPVADMAVSCATTGDYDFFAFNEENTKWLNQKVGANNITNFEQGVGYLYANADATVIDYLGTLIGTETEVTKPLSYACENASYKGFNLMGNPFSRNIVYGDIEIAGTPVTTYYTVEGGSELTSKNLSENPIKPGQGFLVQATGIGQNLVFNPSAKGRANEKVGYISIVAGNSEFTDNAFVQLGDGNTLRKMTLSDNSSVVYVMNNGKDYASTRIDALEGSMPVCFKANTLGTYTITIEAKDIETNYLHLIDNFTHEDIDLLLEPSYTFIASNGDNAVRFTLVFNANNSSVENDIFAYQNGSDIIVNGEGELQVFDVTGRMVMNQHVNGVQTVNMPSNGVYIFKLNEKTQKIVVR